MLDPEKTGVRRRRRDFDESRAMILEAADLAFTSEGIDVSMKEMANRAEVSTATLYRHFANKTALVGAVYERRIGRYAEAIETAQAIENPAEAFRQSIHGVVGLQAGDRFFREFLREHDDPVGDELLAQFAGPLVSAIESARLAGVLRPGVGLVDVLVLLTTLEGIARPMSSISPGGLVRVVDLFLDGICSQRETPEGEPMTFDQLFAVIKN
jgi:AcrR family transcriptional regulator